jgi:hypothetical protein
MSRTFRTPTKTYYGYTPVTQAELNEARNPDSENHRKRWYNGYDGGHCGRVAEPTRTSKGTQVRKGWSDRAAGAIKRHQKRRKAKLVRLAFQEAIRHEVRDMLWQLSKEFQEHPTVEPYGENLHDLP